MLVTQLLSVAFKTWPHMATTSISKKFQLLMNLSVGQEQRSKCKEWTCGQSRGGECGMNWESSFAVYTLAWVKPTASGKLHVTQGARPAVCDGGMVRGGRLQKEELYVHIKLNHIVVQQKLTHFKAILLHLKYNKIF